MPAVLGDRVLELCRQASGDVVVAAPFVKDHALARLLEALPESVTGFTCITRWFPEEVASGVSDLEVFDRLASRPRSKLLLLPTLHAKFFRLGARCLVGSANVTGRAFGWTTPPNLELLAELPVDHPDVTAFMKLLREAASPATAAIKDEVAEAAQRLKRIGVVAAPLDAVEDPTAPSPRTWLPRCTRPDQLWSVYSDASDRWMIVASNVQAAEADLKALGVSPGLSRGMFMQHVGARIRGMALIAEIGDRAAAGIADGDAVALIREAVPDCEIAAEDVWSVLKEWILHFLPGVYRRAAEGEVFLRGREIGSL